MRILLVEDEPEIVQLLENGLGAQGYRILSAATGEDALALVEDETLELALVDITLPGIDGHHVLKRIRARRSELPVLMLTARDDLQNKVSAFDAGADDYLTKPFAIEELLARIRALTRRTDQRQSAQLEAGDLRLDLHSHRVWRGSEQIELSNREFSLLEYFMRHPRHVLSRQQILSAIWDYAFDPGSNVVDVYVRHLRNKIDRAGEPSLITTIRGAGYRFDPPALDLPEEAEVSRYE